MLSLVINLDRDKNRFSNIQKMMASRDIQFTRVAATNARALSQEQLVGLAAFPAPFSREMTAGEIACYLSHIDCWQKLLESNETCAAIFEDDVELSGAAREVLAQLSSWLPREVDIVKLETSLKPIELAHKSEASFGAYDIRRLVGCHIGSAGYIISRQGAEKMLARSSKLFVPVDAALFDPRAAVRCSIGSNMKVMQIIPALCIQNRYDADGSGTTIEERGKRKSYGQSALAIAFNRTRDRADVIGRKISAFLARRRCRSVEYRP